MTSSVSPAFDDPAYRQGVVELLGAIAYGEISACGRLADDAKLAPDLRSKVAIASMATTEFAHFEAIVARLEALGVDPYAAMDPFVESFERFHGKTSPSDYFEGLIKLYVGDSLAQDFYREIAAYLDTETRELVLGVLGGTDHSQFVIDQVQAAIAADPRIGGRLALWGRRLVGEALSQAQQLVAERDALTAVLVGGADRPGLDLAAIGRMFSRITEAHAERMDRLGLAA